MSLQDPPIAGPPAETDDYNSDLDSDSDVEDVPNLPEPGTLLTSTRPELDLCSSTLSSGPLEWTEQMMVVLPIVLPIVARYVGRMGELSPPDPMSSSSS